jgi:hypothetical protein
MAEYDVEYAGKGHVAADEKTLSWVSVLFVSL